MGRSPFPLLDMTTTVTGLFCWRDFHPREWQLASLHWSGRALQEGYVDLADVGLASNDWVDSPAFSGHGLIDDRFARATRRRRWLSR